MEIARACASTAVTLSVHGGLCSTAIERFGTEEQRRRFLPKLASGEWLGAYALSEAGSGSDAGSLRCAATPDGHGGFVLDGHKLWITSGDRADVIVVFARKSLQPAAITTLRAVERPRSALHRTWSLLVFNVCHALRTPLVVARLVRNSATHPYECRRSYGGVRRPAISVSRGPGGPF